MNFSEILQQHQKFRRTILLCSLTIILLFVAGCDTTKITDIQSDFDKFEGKQVTLSGEVIETLSIPFVQIDAYQLYDGTGSIWVIPYSNIPSRGDKVRVTGTVEVSIKIAGENFVMVLMEEK